MGALFPPPNESAAHTPETAPTDTIERVVDLLLVEEDPKVAQTALKAFGKAKLQNSVDVVRDGGAALDYLFCRREFAHRKGSPLPAVVLLDLNLAKSSGMEVLRAMKSAEKMRRIRVVVLTDSSHDEHVREALRLGADAYIIKPLDFQKFSAVMPQLGFHWTLLKRKGIGSFFAVRPAPGNKPEESREAHPGN
jgi:CheY-like chemotaxis protein